MSCRWLILRFEGPLMAFGGVAVDNIGPVRDFPAASMLTGLIANALGWHWSDQAAHQAIQDRLVFAVREDREGEQLVDSQNAQLAKADRGWTTSGEPEGRDGASYQSPHRRQRYYHADRSVRVVLRFKQPQEPPTLDTLADALDRPARPLFLGRKSCFPSVPFLARDPSARWVTGDLAYNALCAVPVESSDLEEGKSLRAWWPTGEGPAETSHYVGRVFDLFDLRNWRTGLHEGLRQVVEGRLIPTKFS